MVPRGHQRNLGNQNEQNVPREDENGVQNRDQEIEELRSRLQELENQQLEQVVSHGIFNHETNSKIVNEAQKTAMGQFRNFGNEKLSSQRYANHKRIRQTLNQSIKYQSYPYGKVVNLSNFKFSLYEYKLLGYNLNFIPTPDFLTKNDVLRDMNKFNRRIKLRLHFTTTLRKNDTYFESKSTWEAENIHDTVIFIEDFSRQIWDNLKGAYKSTQQEQKNMNKNEELAPEDLKNKTDIVICNADKGGAVVINYVNDYIKEAKRQLSDQKFYKKNYNNPTSENAALVNDAIEQLKKQKSNTPKNGQTTYGDKSEDFTFLLTS